VKIFLPLFTIAFLSVLFSASRVMGQELTMNSTSEQQLTTAGTLQVDQGVTLNVNNHPDIQVADTNSGDTIQIKNYGTIEQTGTGGNAKKGIDDTSGADGLNITVTNYSTGLIQTTASDVINFSEPTNNITVNNYGTIDSQNTSAGSNQGVNLGNITSGNNTINNYAGGIIESTDSDAARPGVSGFIYNDGTIKSTDTSGITGSTAGNDGIDAQTNSGVTIVNGDAINGDATTGANLIEGARHGITGGNTGASGDTPLQVGGYTGTGSFTMSVTNNAGATIQGDDGSGINIDGFGIQGTGSTLVTNELVTVTNYGTITGDGVTHDGDGVDVDGDVIINNHGSIISQNAVSSTPGQVEFSEGITVGGGSITNYAGATIEGEVAGGNTSGVGRGITLAGVDQGIDESTDTKYGIPIESIYENSSVTNSGLIKGDSESGITVLGTTGGGYTVTITNNATGTIEGNNSGVAEDPTIIGGPDNGEASGQTKNQAAIELDDTGNAYSVTDYGTIKQDNTTDSTAVAMYGTSNTLNIYGGAASVIGNVSGNTAANSTLTINPGNGNSFSYGYQISNFTVQINSDGTNGTVTLSGANSYSGGTTIKGGTLLVENTTAGTSATGTGSISNTGGVLGGYGAINPTGTSLVSVTTGGTLAPGTTGNTDTMTLSAAGHSTSSNALSITGATLTFNLNTVSGTNFSSSLSLTNAYAGEVVSLSNDTYNFNDLTSGHLGLGDYTLILSDSTTDPFAGLTNATITGLSGYTGTIQINTVAGGDYAVQLDITSAATPEPSTWAMIIAGGLGLTVILRLRRNADAKVEA
jgi:hypothetical protein